MGKLCSRCGVEKDASEFSPDKRAKSGLQPCCKACNSAAKKLKYYSDVEAARARQNNYYALNAEHIRVINAKSVAKNRARVLESKKQYYLRTKDDPEVKAANIERRKANVKEKSEYDKEYRKKNEEKLNLIKAEWRSKNKVLVKITKNSYKHRRRAIEKEGDSTKAIAEWVDGQKKVCYWCSCKCDGSYHIDHYQPLSRGGLHAISNLVIACRTCNVRKNAKDPFEFAASVGRLF